MGMRGQREEAADKDDFRVTPVTEIIKMRKETLPKVV